MPSDANEIQALVNDLAKGDSDATRRLLPLIYDDLRAIAAKLLMSERACHTLQPTALCNEACLRLMGSSTPSWNGKEHLLAVAAIAMRQILVNQARARNTLKRGGGEQRLTLVDVADNRSEAAIVDVLTLESALKELEAEDPTLARIVELRYFAGMSIKQVAIVMNQSDRTINRLWRTAQAELAVKLRTGDGA
ncbi:MAG: ECF-type sigma factor [Phycisphaerae bacterium]